MQKLTRLKREPSTQRSKELGWKRLSVRPQVLRGVVGMLTVLAQLSNGLGPRFIRRPP